MEGNLRIREELRKRGIPVTYEEYPGGHDWDFWDKNIRSVLNWLLK